MIKFKKIYLTPFLIFILFSFSKKTDAGFNLKKFERSLVLIPPAEYHYGVDREDNSKGSLHTKISRYHLDSFSILAEARTIKLDSFYIYKYEVSNREYNAFLSDLKTKDVVLHKRMLPDTTHNHSYSYGEPMLNNYHRHPAYNDFPVVGISYEQANYFCQWLTDKYRSQKKRKFKNARFRLPTTGQWTYAAMGAKSFALFPWVGHSMQNKKGVWLANFKVISQYQIGKSSYLNENQIQPRYIASVPNYEFNIAPVNSYQPNDIGLYNMAGNVEEFVREVGITKGGSWNDTGYYLQTWVEEKYDSTNSASEERGFRFVMELIK